ncbi:general stress protein [Paenibacillus sp. HN-1]|uniref:general stress protein n=1 Tax=Paenibacillus TaxID=44249 RepID=UPI001CAA0738|nr:MULTISPECIES: general stress protein [Paenibacillus]MBY9081169.1 general stress protein [Paenibacillus sp. CGMCC 1.18879]MBY9087206.1 general stress protein [Paenibacillus sinensis]
MNKRIVGVFTNEQDASFAINDLKNHGLRTEDISVIASNRDDINAIGDVTGTKATEGMASGAATGGLLGGVTGLLAGIGALAIPGIGPIIAAGPIAATLAGAAVGAGTGGLVGGLIGLGIPEDEAETYDRYVDEGRILVMVDADVSREMDVYDIFRSNGSLNSHYYREQDPMDGDRVDAEKFTGRSVSDSVDAISSGSGLEGRNDTGLDTANSNPAGGAEHLKLTSPAAKHNSPDAVSDEPEEDRMKRMREEELRGSRDKR